VLFLTEHHAKEAYRRSGGIAPRILNSALDGGEWSASLPGHFNPQGRNPYYYPLHRRLGGPQSRSGYGGEEKNSQPLPGLEPMIIQSVAQRYTTDLSRLFRKAYVYYSVHCPYTVSEEFISHINIVFLYDSF
jgi:hypothetical protein